MAAPKKITVEGVKGAPGEVLVWDRDPEQLDGDRMVYQGGKVQVVETEAIAVAIADGRLKVVAGTAKAATAEQEAAETGESAPKPEGTAQRSAGRASATTNKKKGPETAADDGLANEDPDDAADTGEGA